MYVSKLFNRLQKQRTNKSSIDRGMLVIVLCSSLGIIGALTFNADASTLNLLPAIHSIASNGNNDSQTTSANAQLFRRRAHQVPRQTSQNITKPLDYPVFYGNTRLPEIALTFDDGPNPIYTPQVLAVLQAYNIKATFFDVGYLVKDFPNIVRQEFLQGHSIGNHSWSHPQLTRLSYASILSQLVNTSDAIQSVTGSRPTIFRPPYGSFNRIVLAQASQQKLSTILWNDEAHDWTTPGVNVIARRILNLARYGGIILLHDGGGFRAQTVAALPIIISALQLRGFTFVTIPQLLHDIATSGKPSPTPTATSASSLTVVKPTLVAWKQE
jgi:peptidoglycan/xylan/chitin deacetylase (PgdA/CDA1 family)